MLDLNVKYLIRCKIWAMLRLNYQIKETLRGHLVGWNGIKGNGNSNGNENRNRKKKEM